MKDLNDEIIEKTGELYKENMENITLPISKSIGKNIGKAIDGAFGWIGVWGEKQKVKQKIYIEEFKEEINKGLKDIPNDNIVEPKANIIWPVLETASYYYEEEYYKDMFANLIINSCKKDKAAIIHPGYIATIKQLAPLDAKLLKMFAYNSTYPAVEIRAKNNKDGTITPYLDFLFDFKDKDNEFSQDDRLYLTKSIENLERLGLIIKNKDIIELGYNYDEFKENYLYKAYEENKEGNDNLEMIKYRIELTNYGRDFLDICIK